jgi:small-conductance mechanosensitive channel
MTEVFEGINYGKILLAICIVVITTWLARYVTREGERLSTRYVRHRHWLMNSSAVARFSLYIGGIVLAATTLFTFSKEALLASAGAIALTFSFAFQDLASSFAGGITLLIDRPFQIGDCVTFKDHYGEITEIGLRSVRLRTLDDSIVTVPNNLFLKEAVASANTGALDMMVVIPFYVDPNSPLELAKTLLYEAVVTSKFVFLAKPVTILVEDKIVDVVFCTELTAKAYVFNTRYEKFFATDVTERVKEAFREHGIRSAANNPGDVKLPKEAA